MTFPGIEGNNPEGSRAREPREWKRINLNILSWKGRIQKGYFFLVTLIPLIFHNDLFRLMVLKRVHITYAHLVILLVAQYILTANAIKRCHDFKRNGYAAGWLLLVPVVNLIAWSYLLLKNSKWDDLLNAGDACGSNESSTAEEIIDSGNIDRNPSASVKADDGIPAFDDNIVDRPPVSSGGEAESQAGLPETAAPRLVPIIVIVCFIFFCAGFFMWTGKMLNERKPAPPKKAAVRQPANTQQAASIPRAVQTGPVTRGIKTSKGTSGRYIANGDGTVTDKKTNLMWAARDNNNVVTWQQAKHYCESYRGGGHRGWRMPTRSELAGLYDSGLNGYELNCFYTGIVKVPDLVVLSCYYLWSSDEEGPNASVTDLRDGKHYWIDKKGSFFRIFRVLPVRSIR